MLTKAANQYSGASRALRMYVLAFRGVISYILAKHGAEDDDEVEALLEELEEKQKDPDLSDKVAEFMGANYSDI